MCGDSTDIGAVERLMNGEKADMVFTSPPYNASKNRENNGRLNPTNKYNAVSDSLSDEDFEQFLGDVLNISVINAREVFINLQILGTNRDAVLSFVQKNSSLMKDIIYWVKENSAPHIQMNVTSSRVEWVLAFSSEEPDSKFRNIPEQRGKLTNVVMGPNAAGNEFSEIHKATFPLYFPEHFINTFSSSGMKVIDFFGGTGTTLIACEKTNRKCFMMELDPHYIDVIIARWEKFSGKKAQLVNTEPLLDQNEIIPDRSSNG